MVRKCDEVNLTPDEILVGQFIAETRDQRYQGLHGKPRHKPGICNGKDSNLLGVLGEIAFCKLTNTYPLALDIRECGTIDCRMNGAPVDVKANDHDNPELWIYPGTAHKDKPAAWYVLMHTLDGQNFTYKGRISHEYVMSYTTEQRPGCSPAYIFDAEDLI